MGYPISQNFRRTPCTAFFWVYPISQYFSRRVCTSFFLGYPIFQIFRKRYAPSCFEIFKVQISVIFLLSYVLQSALQFSPVQFNFQNWSIVKLRDTSFLISDPFHSIRLIFSSIHPIRKIKPFQCEKNADVRVMFWKCQKLKSELDPHNFNLIVATCPEKGCSCS